ncbi:MAG: PAS domain S-box protein [Bacteroidetes bacterium]|nr:PAS domain S-box protein [Bacteroidota bacterium]
MKTKKIFAQLFGFIITIMVVIAFVIVLLIQNQYNLLESEKINHESFFIADELRQSSDDLTNYCRLYVMTGDSAWETKYWNVLQIRNGKHPRPDGRQISLRDSMVKLGFTEHEFDLLSSSENNSNELAWTEKVAFNSLKGIFPDSLGIFSIQDEPNISYAQQIMFDEKYLQAKTEIMQPIDEFINQIDKKTHNTVQNYREIGYLLVSLFVVMLLTGIIISLILFLLTKKRLIAQIEVDIALKESNKALQKAKERTEESKAKFKKLSNLTFEGILIHNKGITIDANQSFTKLFGYSLKEIIGKNIIDLTVPEKYHPIVLKNIKKKYALPYEIEFRKKDGSLFPAEVEGKNIESIETNGTTRVVAIRDITQRKKAEKEIKKLSAAVEQSANTIVITDTSGDIEYTNPKFSELTGYAAHEVLGQNPQILNSGMQPKEYYAEMWQTITTGKIWSGEFNNKKKNGDYYWENVTITPMKNEAGEITNFLAIKEDITAQKENEQKILIQNKKLIKAKEKATESDRLKSAFLANMSHEIRTPMNGILGFTELLKEPMLSSKDQHKFISIIEKSGKRLLNIINDVLDISKIESGQMDVSISEINVNVLIKYIYTFFKPEVDSKSIELIFKNPLPEKESIIKTDHEKIFAIFTNLVKNSIKYTNNGFIEIGYVKKSKDFEFFVKDTGLGIPQEKMEIIFERFRQASESHSRKYEGAGLGLSISKAYVELLGGKIWGESEEGKGSIFYFTIPYNTSLEEKIVIEDVDLDYEADTLINKLRVLIAEDNKISERLISRMVNNFSQEVLIATTGVEAVEICRNNPELDLVLMDIQMPEMDGYEAIRQIRKFNKEVVIIAQTAFAQTGDREKAIEAGSNDYISKPILKDKLITLFLKYFNK